MQREARAVQPRSQVVRRGAHLTQAPAKSLRQLFGGHRSRRLGKGGFEGDGVTSVRSVGRRLSIAVLCEQIQHVNGEGIAERIEAAVLELVSAPGRGGVAQATKLLHLKRPRLVPVLDALVRKAIAGPNVEEGPPAQRAARVRVMVEHLRAEGIRLAPKLRAIQGHLRSSGDGIDRTLCRILDGALWCSQVPQWQELNKVIVRWRADDS